MKPASLIKDRLDGYIRQMKMVQEGVISHQAGIQKMYESAVYSKLQQCPGDQEDWNKTIKDGGISPLTI